MTPASITVVVNGRAVAVRELTVSEIRNRLRGEELGSPDIADPQSPESVAEWFADQFITIDGVSMRDIRAMSDVTADDIASAKPSDLGQLVEAIKKANRDFFVARARLDKHLAGVVPTLPTATISPPPAETSSAPSVH